MRMDDSPSSRSAVNQSFVIEEFERVLSVFIKSYFCLKYVGAKCGNPSLSALA